MFSVVAIELMCVNMMSTLRGRCGACVLLSFDKCCGLTCWRALGCVCAVFRFATEFNSDVALWDVSALTTTAYSKSGRRRGGAIFVVRYVDVCNANE